MAHSHKHQHQSTRNIRTAFFLNLGFTVFEIFGGLWTNSMAILADALHDLGDSFSLGLSWYLDKKSKKSGDEKYSFGYHRFSLLGAVINGIILTGGSLYILSEAIPRLLKPEHSNAKGMLLFAIIGIAVNGVAALRMKGGKTMNERMVSWHLLEDVLGWVAVLIVSIVLLFKDIHILDPILSMLIMLYVLYNVFRNLRQTFLIFMQGVPKGLNIAEIEEKIAALDKVRSVHHTQLWSLDGEKHVLTIHVVIEEVSVVREIICIKQDVKALLKGISISHATVEIEFADETCYMPAGDLS